MQTTPNTVAPIVGCGCNYNVKNVNFEASDMEK